jgi:uncharacterized cupredoxin-like copper-binding protein
MPRRLALVLVAGLVLLLAACSAQLATSGSADPDRSVDVSMSDDMRYSPDSFEFFAGQTIRFTVSNVGQLRHEFFVGDVAAHEEHAAEMREMPEDSMGHDEPGLLTLDAGESGTLDYTFAQAGRLLVGCHEPGHYEAGMVADITVHPGT